MQKQKNKMSKIYCNVVRENAIWSEISAAVSFAKAPHLRHVFSYLRSFVQERGDVKCGCPSSKQSAGHRTFFFSREKWKRKREEKSSAQ